MSDNVTKKVPTQEQKTLMISQKDIDKAYNRWWLTAEICNNYERMQGIGWCASIAPILQKFYRDKNDLSKALKRHLGFFNTQATLGAMIFGSTIAIEEQKSKNPDLPEEMITSYKTGLMGPVAGLGDTINYSIIGTLVKSVSSGIAMAGSFLAIIPMVLFSIFLYVEGLLANRSGYRLGRESIKKVMSSGLLKEVVNGASIMGLIMIGSLSAQLVKLTTPLTIGKDRVQAMLDGMVPGLLPLGAIFLVYWFIKHKKTSPSKIILGILVVCILGSLARVF